MKKLIILLALPFITSCTENSRAKSFGGTMTIPVPAGNRVIGATFKEETMWYLYRPFEAGETPKTVIFQEKSSFGMVEGKVIFQESK